MVFSSVPFALRMIWAIFGGEIFVNEATLSTWLGFFEASGPYG